MKILEKLKCKELVGGNYYVSPSVLVGLTIVLSDDQVGNTTEYLNQYFYGEANEGVASSGQFMYLPLDQDMQNDQFFVDMIDNPNEPLLKHIYDKRVSYVDNDTKVEIMINLEVQEDTVEGELAVLVQDLEEFISKGFGVSWEQINL